MSPRRSSRARTTQPSPLIPTQTASSTSSVTSDRAQRATRSGIKPASPHRSAPRSQSRDDTSEDASKPPPRRTRSGATDIKDPSPLHDDNFDEEEDDGQDENEVTRCVCGHNEFPGMPAELNGKLAEVNYVTDEGIAFGDFFVQCDTCKVWQHGGCVGIVDQAHSPDDYFCEECEAKDHEVTSKDGHRYSRYLPVVSQPPYPQSPKSGPRTSKSKDSKNLRQSAETLAHKRRQTLNSRSEQEEIERAIEESKRETLAAVGGAGDQTTHTRLGKRTRDESVEYVHGPILAEFVACPVPPHSGLHHSEASQKLTDILTGRHKAVPTSKRQRTNSDSPVLEPKTEDASEAEPTDADPESTPKSKIRGAAARNHQAKEAREAKERQRQAAANARQARSERRRGDESDHEDNKDDHIPSTAASSPPPEPPASSSRSLKKKVTPGRRGRVGRGQAVQEEDSPEPDGETSLLTTTNPHITRARSRSRSVVRGEETDDGGSGLTPNGNAINTRGGLSARDGLSASRSRENGGASVTFDDGGLLSKPSKPKNFNEKRTSLNEMRKRVAAISEFLGRAQTDAPHSKSASMSRSGSEAGGSGNASAVNGSATTNSTGTSETNGTLSAQRKKELMDLINNEHGRDFGMMTTEEMLDNMRLRTRAWQELFGRYGDKS